MSSFKYLVKQGWHNMAANRLMTLASVGVLTACLLITGIASLISINVNRIVNYLGKQNEIIVYIYEDATPEEIAALGETIRTTPNVQEVRFNSKEDAYTQMQSWMGEYTALLEGVEDIFPASYRVTVESLEQIANTSQRFVGLPGVEEVSTPTELAGVMVTIKNAVNYSGWGLVAILGIVSIIIISNTIRLTVFARRREISIMKYVGATNGFIRLPFFVEGMSVGVIAGLISSAVVCTAYYFVVQYIKQSGNLWVASITSGILPLSQVWYWLLIGFVSFGVLIGSLGTVNSIRKHLRV
jgi:cell division transport system permease protein